MSTAPLNHRMSSLEEAMADLARAQARTEASLDRLSKVQERTEAGLDRVSNEMRASSLEADRRMGELDDRLAAIADRSDRRMAELGDHTDRRMAELDDRLAAIADRSDRRMAELGDRTDRRMGEFTNQLGRLVEDIVGPSIPNVFAQLFGAPATESGIRHRRRHPSIPGRERELDAFAAGGDTLLVVEVKSQITARDVVSFVRHLPEVREFFPALAQDRRLVGAVASFHIDESLVRAAERRGLYVFGLVRNMVELLNSAGFEPKAY